MKKAMINYIQKEYLKSNRKCILCNAEVTLKDIQENNFVYSETKRKSRLFVHRSCFERRM